MGRQNGRGPDGDIPIGGRPDASDPRRDGPYIIDDVRTFAPKVVDVVEILSLKTDYFGTFFVPLETLKQNVGLPVSVLLSFGCSQRACIFTDFTSAIRSICSNREMSGVCEGQDQTTWSSLLGLEVYIENSGSTSQTRAQYNLFVPAAMRLQKVVDITKFRTATIKKLSEAKALLKHLTPMQFQGRRTQLTAGLRENYLGEFQEYVLDIPEVPPNSNLTLLLVASGPPNPSGDVLFGLNADPSKQTVLYSSRSRLAVTQDQSARSQRLWTWSWRTT